MNMESALRNLIAGMIAAQLYGKPDAGGDGAVSRRAMQLAEGLMRQGGIADEVKKYQTERAQKRAAEGLPPEPPGFSEGDDE